MRGIRCFDFVFAKSRSRVLEGIPAGLLHFRVGLLDVKACILKFRSYLFVFISKSLELLCQPGDLLVEHVEVYRRWWRWCGLHIHFFGLYSQVICRFTRSSRSSAGCGSVFLSVSVQSTAAGAFVSLQTVTEGLRHGLRRLRISLN